MQEWGVRLTAAYDHQATACKLWIKARKLLWHDQQPPDMVGEHAFRPKYTHFRLIDDPSFTVRTNTSRRNFLRVESQ